jgi:hypothetical protein
VNFSLFWAQKLVSVQEDMKIKKNAFSTLVLEFLASLLCEWSWAVILSTSSVVAPLLLVQANAILAEHF